MKARHTIITYVIKSHAENKITPKNEDYLKITLFFFCKKNKTTSKEFAPKKKHHLEITREKNRLDLIPKQQDNMSRAGHLILCSNQNA